MNIKSTVSAPLSQTAYMPTPPVLAIAERYGDPALRSFAQAMCTEEPASNILGIVIHIDDRGFRQVADELDAVSVSLCSKVGFLPRPDELNRLLVTLMFVRVSLQRAGQIVKPLAEAWEESLRQQLRLLENHEAGLAALLRHVLGFGNDDDRGPRGIQELRQRARSLVDGIHRHFPRLSLQIQQVLVGFSSPSY